MVIGMGFDPRQSVYMSYNESRLGALKTYLDVDLASFALRNSLLPSILI
jgi:hypothetical protein